jgi:coproporphyrinogen III oxidase-like Fe-S oxidoreductase
MSSLPITNLCEHVMNPEDIISIIASNRTSPDQKPLQVYLHIPFCASKCHFCDWVDDIPVAQLKSGPGTRQRYVDTLCRQILYWGPHLSQIGYRPTSIYWGGGTPTRLDLEDFTRIANSLSDAFDLTSLVQHTMESTPNELTPEKLERIRGIGVDRLSIGVQSFDPDQLRRAGRAHSAEQAMSAVAMAQRAGITDINIDIISGFPDEDLAAFRRTLDIGVSLNPTHISVYSYRATPRTTMAVQTYRNIRHALQLDAMIESYELAQDVLERNGYTEYCFNYFAKQDKYEFKAGMYGYQLQGDIIGFGAGASSTIGTMSLTNPDVPLENFMQNPLAFESVAPFSVEKPEIFFPLFGGALMTRDGILFQRFEYLTGIPFAKLWQSPAIRAWFQYVENCGAKLKFETTGIRNMEPHIHRVYLKNLAYTLNPVLLKQE